MTIQSRWSVLFAPILPVIAALTADTAQAQCLEWKSGFAPVGIYGAVYSMEVFDDGSGPALYAHGILRVAEGVAAEGLARWDGARWMPVPGEPGAGFAMRTLDDGTGPALYVASWTVHRWNGATWSNLGALGGARCLEVFDDGSGPAIYAGTEYGIHRWNGTNWTQVDTHGSLSRVFALKVFDDGSGLELFAAGDDGYSTEARVLKWDGTAWSRVGSGNVDTTAQALAVYDDGHGEALYVGGNFTRIGTQDANGVARWDGANWSALGGGVTGSSSGSFANWLNPSVTALAVVDDGSGAMLYTGGFFTHAEGRRARSIAKWDGSSWSSIGDVLPGVLALAAFDDGGGPELYAGGNFEVAGSAAAQSIAKWDGAAWSSVLGAPPVNGVSRAVVTMELFDEGSGPALYAGGYFLSAGPTPAAHVARWDGQGWSALGEGANGPVLTLAAHDDGSGPALYAGGPFTTAGGLFISNAARWDGGAWTALGAGPRSPVAAFAVYDDGGGPALYAGCDNQHEYQQGAPAIERWDGTSWTVPGGGMSGQAIVSCLAVFDSGGGPELYAGGTFAMAGGIAAQSIARWNGSTWSPLGSGIGGGFGGSDAHALAVFDDGTGPALYVGGSFDFAGGVAARNLARWDGSGWSAVGDPPAGEYYALHVADDGRGRALFAGGYSPGGGALARWDGTEWTAITGALQHGATYVLSLATFAPAGGAPDLYVGGTFFGAGGLASSNFAAWRGCSGPGTLFCSGELPSSPCPCSNAGSPGRGCANSENAGGSLLVSAGSTNPDSVVLSASGETASALSLFLQGTASSAAVPYGDGIRCASGALKRLYTYAASGGLVSAPAPGDPSITARSAALGDPIAPGTTRTYQTAYRDPASFGCSSDFNATNAVRIAW